MGLFYFDLLIDYLLAMNKVGNYTYDDVVFMNYLIGNICFEFLSLLNRVFYDKERIALRKSLTIRNLE